MMLTDSKLSSSLETFHSLSEIVCVYHNMYWDNPFVKAKQLGQRQIIDK